MIDLRGREWDRMASADPAMWDRLCEMIDQAEAEVAQLQRDYQAVGKNWSDAADRADRAEAALSAEQEKAEEVLYLCDHCEAVGTPLSIAAVRAALAPEVK